MLQAWFPDAAAPWFNPTLIFADNNQGAKTGVTVSYSSDQLGFTDTRLPDI
ncbi:hypothetical protein [Paenibacillus sp. GCM10012306]|uniref:hypothetical protein n=1 Tax=Paenibacillus sp. GCM10012306 TaxID=3317342 RepID=UPI003610CCE2